MRRALLLAVVFGGFLVGVGCKQIAGRNDCTYDPNDAIVQHPTNPYPLVGAPIPGTPPVLKTEPERLPETKGK